MSARKRERAPAPRVMTIKKYAELIGKSASTIRAMCLQGRMPGASRPGLEWLIDVEAARAAVFLRRGRQPAP